MIQRCRFGIGLVVMVALAVTPQLAWSQSNVSTGQLFGTATDPDGAVLPGVAVMATNASTGFSRTTVTDASGFYRIGLLPPGSYEVRTALAGFKSELMRGVTVTLGSSVRIDFAMQLSAVEEEIVVTGESPVVETSNPSVASSVSEGAIANLPLEGRDFQDFVLLTPGTGVSDLDQVEGGRNGVNIGARAIQNSFNIDGSNAQSSFFGEERGGTRPPFTFSQSAIKEMQVLKSPYNLQYSATGGVINAITKSGTNDFHGEVFGYYTDDSLTEEDALGRKADSQQLQYGFALGGPFVRDKLHFFTSLDTQDFETPHFTDWADFPEGREAEFEAITGLDYDQETSSYPTTNDALVILLKLDWQLGANHLLSGRYNFSDQEGENLTSTYEDVGESNNGLEKNSFDSLVLTLNSVLSDDMFNEAFVQLAFEDRPRAPNNTTLPETQIYPYLATFGQTQYHPSGLDEERLQIVDNLSYYAGNHTLKGGINVDLVTFDNYFPRYASGVYSFTGWGNFFNGTPYSFDQGFSDYDFRVKFDTDYYAFYLQDDWRASSNLTVTYGLRYDFQDNQQPEETNPLWPETGQIPNDSNNWTLRAGFAWDIGGDGKSVVRGGVGRFYDNTPTILTSTARLSNGIRTVRISQRCAYDTCPAYPDVWGSQGDLEAQTGDIFYMDPGFQNAETNRISLGYERQVGRDFSLGVDVIYSETDRLQQKQDQNIAPDGGTTPDGRPTYDHDLNPDFDQIVMYNSFGWADYTAVVLRAKKRFANNWFLDASYTWADANDTDSNERSTSTSSDYPEDQYNLDNDWGPSAWSIEHKFVGSLSWQLPLNFMVSAIGSWRSGYPYSAEDGRDNNGDGYANERAMVEVSPGVFEHYARNTERQPDAKNLDLRLSWTARLGGNLELELIGEVFNVTNAANWYTTNKELVSRYGEINDDFGELNRVGKPRRYQLGAKFRF
jgi:outer membrane receptor protein involved in Fe transport